MSNFNISFEYPWLLLLLIPAVFFTLLPYFRIKKKYRRTRNRVVSIVLHSVIMLLCILALSGLGFSYDISNVENEVILLVDVSYSGEEVKEARDAFIKDVVDNSGSDYKVGVVTFGYTQVYAAKITDNAVAKKVYEQYLNADMPDDSATDIASALNYARELFSYPETAKIVLISDGLETDNTAKSMIRSLVSDGITVDTICFTEANDNAEVQISSVVVPDYSVAAGDVFNFELTLESTYAGEAEIKISDNGVENEEAVKVNLVEGSQTISLEYSFSLPGLHELSFQLTSSQDTLLANNIYSTYMYLEVFDNILILEGYDGESAALETLLSNEYMEYQVTVKNIIDAPYTLDELRDYDEIILVNIANNDMPAGFDDLLNSYVYDCGGGLFTFGGNEEDDATVAHAYNRDDMFGTQYQRMLPVQVIDFTPPIALMMVIDISGSMQSVLSIAKEGATACVDQLSSRDYCGVMSLESTYSEEISITAATTAGKRKINSAIYALESSGGTMYSPAIMRAGQALAGVNNVEKKHIMLVTDGYPGDAYEKYSAAIANCFAQGITVSIISIGNGNEADMRAAVALGGGKYFSVNVDSIIGAMKEDLTDVSIDEVSEKAFTPTIRTFTSAVKGLTQADIDGAPQLLGYYGTNTKDGATIVLAGQYIPVYAQWSYGAGKVGSFLSSVAWSIDFLESSTGQRFLRNVVNGLFPTENIEANDITATLTEDNYGTRVNIYTDLEEGQSLKVTVYAPNGEGGQTEQTLTVVTTDTYSRADFSNTVAGVYYILIEKTDESGNAIAYRTMYRAFSYSEEYNEFVDLDEGVALLEELANLGKGSAITSAEEILEGMVKSLHREYDPRLPLIIITIVLFLLDIAVRKFKFKWLHEVIRERKAQKATSHN